MHHVKPSIQNSGSRTGWWVWVVVAVWFVSSGAALWSFELQDARPYAEGTTSLEDWQPAVTEAENWFQARGAADAGKSDTIATWIHVYESGCRCNKYTDSHVEQIRKRFAKSQVDFVQLDRAAVSGTAKAAWLGATPAALVFDASGRLAYIGPYSDSAWCGTGAGFVENALERLIRRDKVTPQPVFARGCFCDPDSTEASSI
jgi:hypothetical protein